MQYGSLSPQPSSRFTDELEGSGQSVHPLRDELDGETTLLEDSGATAELVGTVSELAGAASELEGAATELLDSIREDMASATELLTGS